MKRIILFFTLITVLNVYAQTPLNWVDKFSPDFAMAVSNVKPDGLGNIYVIGTYSGTVDFDFSEDEYFLEGEGFSDIFILK